MVLHGSFRSVSCLSEWLDSYTWSNAQLARSLHPGCLRRSSQMQASASSRPGRSTASIELLQSPAPSYMTRGQNQGITLKLAVIISSFASKYTYSLRDVRFQRLSNSEPTTSTQIPNKKARSCVEVQELKEEDNDKILSYGSRVRRDDVGVSKNESPHTTLIARTPTKTMPQFAETATWALLQGR